MARRNYNTSISLFFFLALILSCSFKQSSEDGSKYDRFISKYTDIEVNEVIVTKTHSEIVSSEFDNKRFETNDFTYYYGRLVSDAYFEDHLNNIVSKERKEVWSILKDFDKYERYGTDSNQIFHEVIIDDVLIGYYLKDPSAKDDIEEAFEEFLKNEFDYQVTDSFPANIFE